MMHILLAIGTVVGVVALAIVCLRIREPGLASFSSLSLWSASQPEPPEPPERPESPANPVTQPARKAPAPAARAAKPRPPASSTDRVERFSERRVELAARQLVAEVEEYLAGQANSR